VRDELLQQASIQRAEPDGPDSGRTWEAEKPFAWLHENDLCETVVVESFSSSQRSAEMRQRGSRGSGAGLMENESKDGKLLRWQRNSTVVPIDRPPRIPRK
jgi:hypothetical protein